FDVAARAERLAQAVRERDREIDDLRRKLASGGGRDLLAAVVEVGGVKLLATRTEGGDPKALREVAEQLRDRLGSGRGVLGGVADGKVSIGARVTRDLTERLHAGKIVGAVPQAVGGKGGGRPDMAQGGGSEVDKLDQALASVAALLKYPRHPVPTGFPAP